MEKTIAIFKRQHSKNFCIKINITSKIEKKQTIDRTIKLQVRQASKQVIRVSIFICCAELNAGVSFILPTVLQQPAHNPHTKATFT